MIYSPKLTARIWQEAEPQKETHLNQPQCFRCELLVSGRVIQGVLIFIDVWIYYLLPRKLDKDAPNDL